MDEQGYQVHRGAVAAETIEAYGREREAVREGLLARERGAEHVELLSQASEDAGAVDPYAIVHAARSVLLAEDVLAALAGDDAPLLFDAAETGAAAFEDGPYRDATYVALASEPETLVTVVVALGGDASIEVYPGSQAIETTAFSGRYRHFNPERDGERALAQHREELAAGLSDAERIELAAGDVLVLAADTVHRAATGAALIAHLCPSRVRPGWFAYRPERARHASFEDGRAWIASQHYDLVDAFEPEDVAEPPARAEELERVEEALREHDVDAAEEAPRPATSQTLASATPPRRSGGLVDSVRGMLGRRGRR
ncbi:phytanoyl-CoA dioxygenase family protein [Baekduia sp. Peel2402]|uniref:phytanoyl-CoA dioxygenase family protein n=1 Tax=Baekduia sp. Peel2402 TaxID=3458296 RepID=UPI00403EE18F